MAVLHRVYCIIIDLATLNGLIRNFNDIPIFTPYKMLVGHFLLLQIIRYKTRNGSRLVGPLMLRSPRIKF